MGKMKGSWLVGVKEEIALEQRLIFGRNLKAARQEMGLSQRDITARAGFAQSFISEVENGRSTINLDNMAVLAKLLNKPLWQLLTP